MPMLRVLLACAVAVKKLLMLCSVYVDAEAVNAEVVVAEASDAEAVMVV